jgi:hypothetical protein
MVSFARIAFPFGEDSMMELLYGKKVFGGQLFVTCSLLLLAALSVAGAQVADVTPKFDGVHVDALDADAWNGVVFRGAGVPAAFRFCLPIWIVQPDVYRWPCNLRRGPRSRPPCAGRVLLPDVVGRSSAQCAGHAGMVAD